MCNRNGFALVLMAVLIAVVGVAGLGAAKFFATQTIQTQLRIDQTKAHYLAQAGVMRAVWDWYSSDTTTDTSRRFTHNSVSGSNGTTVVGNNVFKFGYDGNEGSPSINQSNFAYYASSSTPPIAFVKFVAAGNNKTAGTTVTATIPAAGVAQGNFLVVFLAMDGASGAVSAADTQGNTYTYHAPPGPPTTNAQFATPGAGNVRTAILYAPVTTALVSGNVITVTHPSVTARAISVLEFSSVTTVDQAVGATGTGTSASSGNVTTTVASELIVGGIGVEGIVGDAFTAGSGYTTNTAWESATSGGTAATNVTINPEYKIVSATGTYVGNGTPAGASSRDWAAVVATFYYTGSDTANWFTSGSDRQLRQWRVYNIHNANSITLTQMKVSWSPSTGGERLNAISLNGTSVWTGTGTSGTTFNITDTAIAYNSSAGGTTTYLQWNGAVAAGGNVDVTCQFIFRGDSSTLDATSHEVEMWSGSQVGAVPAHKTFTVLATGEVTQTSGSNNFKVLETVKAVVSGAPAATSFEIMDWDEGDQNIP